MAMPAASPSHLQLLPAHRHGFSPLPSSLALAHGPKSYRTLYFSRSSVQRCMAAMDPEELMQREEARWAREEQRWMREEERWQREQQRWQAERAALQGEIQSLKAALGEVAAAHPALLERMKGGGGWGNGLLEGGVGRESAEALEAELVLRRLPDRPAVAILGSGLGLGLAPEAEEAEKEKQGQAVTGNGSASVAEKTANEILKEVPDADIIAAVASRTVGGGNAGRPAEPPQVQAKKQRSLGMGAEGEDVKKMQLALAAQGYYPGEDDLLNDYFSEETESAVKTWQATIGVRENGVMSAELLSILYGETEAPAFKPAAAVKASTTASRDSSGRAPRATIEKREIERYPRTDIEAGSQGAKRVFLLGENRWEEPDRVALNNARLNGTSGKATRQANCFVCRGEGVLVCTECEGTGDLNVEEQFLDWAGEEPKCLYCGGSGSTTCDTCRGSGVQ